MRSPKRWTILDGMSYTGSNGKMNWTTDLEDAREVAQSTGGIVVDADWLSKHWGDYVRTGVVPESALPPAEKAGAA